MSSPTTLLKPKALAVDDAKIQLAYLSHLLEINGFDVRSANGAAEALNLLSTELVDIIITDVVMPDKTGYELCKAVRQNERTKHIPVVLLTSLNDVQDILTGLECGADDYVCKPFDDESLIESVRTILNKPYAEDTLVNSEIGTEQIIEYDPKRVLQFLRSTFEHYACAKQRELETQLGQAQQRAETEKARMEAEKARLEAERANERTKMEKLDQERMNQFYAMTTHELRAPLTSMVASLSFVLEGIVTSEQENIEMVQLAHSQCQRLLRLVNDFLDMKKLEAGKVDLHKERCSAANLVSASINGLKSMADKAEIIVRREIATDSLLVTDADRLIQVITNFLSNAIKFSHSGAEVAVIVESIDAAMRISVIDKGPGISDDDAGKLFGCFQQLSSVDNHGFSGSGLGLAMCKEIMTALGGTLGFSSQLGKGSTFWLELPHIADHDQSLSAPSSTVCELADIVA